MFYKWGIALFSWYKALSGGCFFMIIKKYGMSLLCVCIGIVSHASQETMPTVHFKKSLQDYVAEVLRDGEQVQSQPSREVLRIKDEVLKIFQKKRTQMFAIVDKKIYDLAWKFLTEKYKHDYKYIGNESVKEQQKTVRVRELVSVYVYNKRAREDLDTLSQQGFGSWIAVEGAINNPQFFLDKQFIPVSSNLFCMYDCLEFVRDTLGMDTESFVQIVHFMHKHTNQPFFENIDENFNLMSVEQTRRSVMKSLRIIQEHKLDKDIVRIMHENKSKIALEKNKIDELNRNVDLERLALERVAQEKILQNHKETLVKKVFRQIVKINEQNENLVRESYNKLKRLVDFKYRNSEHAAYVERVRKNRKELPVIVEQEAMDVQDDIIALPQEAHDKTPEEMAKKAQVEQLRKQRRALVVAKKKEKSESWGALIFKGKDRYIPGYTSGYDKAITIDSAVQTENYACMCSQCCWHDDAVVCDDDHIVHALSIHGVKGAAKYQGRDCNQKSCWIKAALEKSCLCNACSMLRKITQDADRGDMVAQEIMQRHLKGSSEESEIAVRSLYKFASCL